MMIQQVLDSEKTGSVSWEQFLANEKKLGSMLYPAFRLQKQLRSKVEAVLVLRLDRFVHSAARYAMKGESSIATQIGLYAVLCCWCGEDHLFSSVAML